MITAGRKSGSATEIDLVKPFTRFEFPLYVSDREIGVGENGICRIHGKDRVLIVTPTNLCVISIEPIEITDPRHLEVWESRVVKIRFEAVDLEKAIFGLSIKLG